LQISTQARADFDDILLDTQAKWGINQAEIYEELIDRALGNLLGQPEMGRECSDLFDHGRRLRIGSHIIYYSFSSGNGIVRILRILHERRMPTPDQFSGEAE
jgi:toxin ParE1/3/4